MTSLTENRDPVRGEGGREHETLHEFTGESGSKQTGIGADAGNPVNATE